MKQRTTVAECIQLAAMLILPTTMLFALVGVAVHAVRLFTQ